jgi:4-diphosphocytidyl-2-C-methyl-D-erythritol kinase
MVLFPNAKINLGLSVTEKRGDGYHNIQTILYPVPLCDALELVKSADRQFRFHVSGLKIPGDVAGNLCMKAWELMDRTFSLPPVSIHLHKAIPTGAGLGGGSADGAFMIRLIDQVFDLNLSAGTMEEYARQLGSDCPFFIRNAPAYADEKGDRPVPLPVDLSGKFLVIVKPNVHISTGDAYASIMPAMPETDPAEIVARPVEEWRNLLTNDFESVLISKFPEIGRIKSKLYEFGALFALMSGSGSAVYGIFDRKAALEKYFAGNFYWCGRL